MKKDWEELIKLTGDNPIEIERVHLPTQGISIEGRFNLPPMAQLSMEEQVFIAAFIKNHGSIKQMEQTFGISYPTVKNRLNRIGEKMEFTEIKRESSAQDILEQLDQGSISVDDAIAKIQQ